MDAAARALGSRGQRLHVHETHIRRIADGKFLVTHDLRDRHGNPPMDGQSNRREHSVDNAKELAAHVEANAPEESPQEEAAESPMQEAAEPGE